MRILVAIESVDLRKGIDGLAQLCSQCGGVPATHADIFSRFLSLAKNVSRFCLRRDPFFGHFRTSPNHLRQWVGLKRACLALVRRELLGLGQLHGGDIIADVVRK
jgi:hypothetical protein